jgi:hypothetical protein
VKRRLLLAIPALLILVAAGWLHWRDWSRERSAHATNPANFVASDVARLAATGRPQLVEVFHYG